MRKILALSLLVCIMLVNLAVPVMAQSLADEVEHDGSRSGLLTGEPIRTYNPRFVEDGRNEVEEQDVGEPGWLETQLGQMVMKAWMWLHGVLAEVPTFLFFPVNLTVSTSAPAPRLFGYSDTDIGAHVNSADVIAAFYGFFARAVAIALVAIIGFYGFKVMIGQAEIPPVAFFTRMVFVVFGLTVGLPLMQDILNINNHLVAYLLNPSSELFGSRIGIVQGSAWADVIKTTVANVGAAQTNQLMLLLIVVVFGIQLLILWVMGYWRMWEIFLLAIVSPVAFASLLLPSWSGIWSQWLNSFIRVTFQQLIWATIFTFGVNILVSLMASGATFLFMAVSLITFAGILMSGGGIVMGLLSSLAGTNQMAARSMLKTAMGGVERAGIGMQVRAADAKGFKGFVMAGMGRAMLAITGAESFVTTGKWGYIDRNREMKRQADALAEQRALARAPRDPGDNLRV